MIPPLVTYATEDEYRQHFVDTYCRGPLLSYDGIPVYFRQDRFSHAFFECSQRDGCKDVFSTSRAERIDWIAFALRDPGAELYAGWYSGGQRYDHSRRLTVVVNDFVVIIRLKKKKDGFLKGEFVTCYVADNSIGKIRQSPRWNLQACLAALR